MDREKVIKGLQSCQNIDVICMDISCYEPDYSECPYHGRDNCVAELCRDALALLKEQEDLGTELTNAVELIRKKNERIEMLLKEQEAVVRCKDCKHYHKGFGCDLMQRPSVGKDLDWFCADGEHK